MEAITFEDNLVHYKNKLSEAMEYVREVSVLMNAALGITDISWRGDSAKACTIKLEDLKLELEKAQEALTHAAEYVSHTESTITGIII